MRFGRHMEMSVMLKADFFGLWWDSRKKKKEKTLTSFICPLLRGKQGTCIDVHLKVEGWRFGWRWYWGGWIEEGDSEKKYWGNNDGGGWGKKCNINMGNQHVGCDNEEKEEERGWWTPIMMMIERRGRRRGKEHNYYDKWGLGRGNNFMAVMMILRKWT